MRKLLLLLLLGTASAGLARTPAGRLLDAIDRITKGKRASVGVAVLLPGSAEVIASGEDDRYPMMSVFNR
ncbi:MAG: hypothetical protein K2I59_02120, partial [Alistipes sp.]|nr:hypothetical protein [Alistipes sp.]